MSILEAMVDYRGDSMKGCLIEDGGGVHYVFHCGKLEWWLFGRRNILVMISELPCKLKQTKARQKSGI